MYQYGDKFPEIISCPRGSESPRKFGQSFPWPPHSSALTQDSLTPRPETEDKGEGRQQGQRLVSSPSPFIRTQALLCLQTQQHCLGFSTEQSSRNTTANHGSSLPSTPGSSCSVLTARPYFTENNIINKNCTSGGLDRERGSQNQGNKAWISIPSKTLEVSEYTLNPDLLKGYKSRTLDKDTSLSQDNRYNGLLTAH